MLKQQIENKGQVPVSEERRKDAVDAATGLFGQQPRGYQKPVLQCYGDVRDITLGPSPGLAESGNPFTREA